MKKRIGEVWQQTWFTNHALFPCLISEKGKKTGLVGKEIGKAQERISCRPVNEKEVGF
ncbi:hypothetical protein ACD591_04300 [Rufibacter glacialis]|uniref:Uncharacterized protein n=1 Tax=Rufibacter glacialis TaxID=1259555 RepID=A0ABV4RD35_9BACT|nr:hypothetical protein [Rufibacter glacialis]